MSLEEIKENFDSVWKKLHDFIPIGSKEEAKRLKRKGLSLEQEIVKKLKTSEEVSEEAKSPDEVPEEKVELKRLYEPDDEDQKWTHTQDLMHALVEWKLYDTYGVHHVTAKDKEIFMLVEKDYPLRKVLAHVRICYKLQVENYSQMENDLILKIYKIANSPRQQVTKFPLAEEVLTASEESSHYQKKRDAIAKRIALLCMQTQSSSKFVSESSSDPISTNSKHRNRRRSKPRVEPFSIPIVTMADNRTMEEMLQAPTEGIISTLKFRDVPNDAIKLMLFPYSLEGAAKIWYEKEPPRSILTWGDLANDAVMKNMQTQMTSLTNSNIELKNMFGQFMKTNTASSLGSGSLLSNTVPNPQEDFKAITTRSGVTLAGPSTPLPPFKEVDQEPEMITDQIPESDLHQPSVAQTQVPIYEPVVAPTPKPTIPYPPRANKQKLREKDDNLALKFVENFRILHLELSFTDALLHMPKFSLMFKSLLNNKEKLFDLATTLRFLPELTSTQMIIELADRSTTRPAGIAEDVFVKLGKFYFLTNFVVVDYVVDPRVPLILGRPFLRTGRALIDVYGEELTLRVDDEAITFKVGQTSKYSYNDAESINQIDVIDVAYGFSGYFHIPINPQDQEKTTFTCPYGTFSYRRMPFGLCNAPGTFQRCMMAIFHDMIEKTMEEKCHFMVKEGIVLGHKISKFEIEVDRAKVDVIAKLPHPTYVKGAENLAADHLSRLEIPYQDELRKKEITKTFPLETLGMIGFRGDSSTPWFADIANYYAGNFIVKGMSSQQKKKFFKDVKHYF
uniref:DNA-directed DNA polymerase n=1 Tax=Tanacetum cinerariifolium TaxID=118510 RepID=A0A6L2LV21_TANCI|nr:DNA-directed DNA polymerase [Tanacetum cinerariifolium]